MDRLPRPSLENRVSSYPRYGHVTPLLYLRYKYVTPSLNLRYKHVTPSLYLRYKHVTPSSYLSYTNVNSPPVDITLFYLFLEIEVSASGSSYIIHDTNMP